MAVDPNIAAALRRQADAIRDLQSRIASGANAPSIEREIAAREGKRIYYPIVGVSSFTIDQDGQRGEPINFQVSQDGPFVMTHYPVVAWKPNAPSTATNKGRWSPCRSWPLPQMESATPDIIDISYELVDGGSQRNFQSAAAPPVFSSPENLLPLPCPTLFEPNALLLFYPTFENILFDSTAAVPTTGGQLVVALQGYRILSSVAY